MTAIAMIRYGDLPAVQITAPGGERAIVTLYGAHLVSWCGADGTERLFCSTLSALDGSRAIRGGVPVIFPQFAERGSGMRHGFARIANWRLDASGPADATFTLRERDLTPAVAQAWPHAFALRLTVALTPNQLHLALEVSNSGESAFAFSSALHTYFLVQDIASVRIGGVQEAPLQFDDKFDHIYRDVGPALTLAHGGGALALTQTGFKDAVVWNPGAADTAALADMQDDEYRRFVCVEPALIEPVTVLPGGAWHGAHRISIVD